MDLSPKSLKSFVARSKNWPIVGKRDHVYEASEIHVGRLVHNSQVNQLLRLLAHIQLRLN